MFRRHSYRLVIVMLAMALLAMGMMAAPPATQADRAPAGESLVRVPYKGPATIRALNEHNIEIVAFTRYGLDVLANERQLDYLYTLGYPIAVIQTPDMLSSQVAPLDANLGLYYTYAELDSALDSLVTTYPGLAARSSIGTTIEGRDIYMLKISDNVAIDEPDEPEVLYMGCHHARELMSVDIPIRFAQYLLANYGSDETVTRMVDEREIFFVPMVNPDGHVYVENNHASNSNYWWRKNRRDNLDGSYGVDLNRNYSYQWGYDNTGSSPTPSSDVYRGSGPFSEPETQAIRDFCAGRDFTLAFSYHSYGELLLFPWGYIAGYTPDHEAFLKLGNILAENTGYLVGNTAMGAIYPTNGDSDDWAYGETVQKNSFFCYTPEVNSSGQGGFGPDDTWIQPTFNLLLDMNMKLLLYADNPYKVLGPVAPTAAVDNSFANYAISWTGNAPQDPNPAVEYEVCQLLDVNAATVDNANGVSPWWEFDGFALSGARSYQGSGSYYSGEADNYSSTLASSIFYPVTAESDTFTARVWYDIETNWDYAYFEVSTDQGVTWQSIPGNLTTTYDPYGNNLGFGITGATPGGSWVQAIFPLTAYVGQNIHIRWHYVTDQSVTGEGIYLDVLDPVPTYQDKQTIGGLTGTSVFVNPGQVGTFSYQVRGRDAEGDYSAWSNVVEFEVASVVGLDREAAPLASRLGPNKPNPFNPVTRIPYAVGADNGPAPVPVRLDIYDVTGRRVATLVNRDVAPGAYEAVWTATNSGGTLVPSGVYFAKLVVGSGEPMVRKLVLLK